MEEIKSLKDLYKLLQPAFKVKKRLLKYSCFEYITNKDIWEYLTINKWKYVHNLTIEEMVDDIINIDNIKLHLYLYDKLFESTR